MPSAKATALLSFDSTKKFRVEDILNYHAYFWKCGTCNKFVEPFERWNAAMQRVVKISSDSDEFEEAKAAAVALSLEAARCRKEEYQATTENEAETFHNINRGMRNRGKVGGEKVYFWDNVRKDWIKRGIIEDRKLESS